MFTFTLCSMPPIVTGDARLQIRADRSGNSGFWVMLEGLFARPQSWARYTGAVLALGIALKSSRWLVWEQVWSRALLVVRFLYGRVHPSSCHSSDGKANTENKPPIQSRTPKIQASALQNCGTDNKTSQDVCVCGVLGKTLKSKSHSFDSRGFPSCSASRNVKRASSAQLQ